MRRVQTAFRGQVARLRGLWCDTSGIVLPYATILLAVFVGGALLAVDGARYADLQTQLQKGADAYALTAAAELDGRSGAIARATNAVNNLVVNRQTFGVGSADIQVQALRFLKDLPSDEVSPIPGAYDTTDDLEARFVEVTVVPVTMNTILPATFFGAAANTATTTASAVAGFDEVVCKFTPVYICKPTNIDIYKQPAQIKLRQDPAYPPGSWGLLQAPGQPGMNAVAAMLGNSNPPTCFSQRNGVYRKEGNGGSRAQDAVNVRFDLYENSAKGLRNDPNFTPAPNVRKGYATKPSATDGICLNSNKDVVYDPDQPPSKQPNAPAIGFPREPCFYAGTCSPVSTTGTWEWDIDTYWAVNHPTEPCKSKKSQVWDGAGPKPSRYFVYQKELELDCVSDRSKGDAGGQMKETGSKTCSKQPAGGAERRILYAAVIDCSKVSGGTSTPMAVEAFAKFFITEPVHNPSDPVIWAEFIGIVEPGTDKSVARDNVQLYR